MITKFARLKFELFTKPSKSDFLRVYQFYTPYFKQCYECIHQMIPIEIDSFHFFRVPSEKPNAKKPEGYVEDETAPKEPDNGEYIRCRQCHQILTRPAERIEVQGAHQHAFANPQGIVYHLGCFRSVSGCGYVGPATDEFTWFRGFSWRIAICSMCLTHLGWLFMSKGNESFNGLILDRLMGP